MKALWTEIGISSVPVIIASRVPVFAANLAPHASATFAALATTSQGSLERVHVAVRSNGLRERRQDDSAEYSP